MTQSSTLDAGNREVSAIRDELARDIAWHVVHGRKIPDDLLREYRQAKALLRRVERADQDGTRQGWGQ